MIVNEKSIQNKVLGCWFGKNIGGTLGAPFEWRRQINHVTDYTQDLGGKALPNDDLDIQLLWLIALEERKLNVDARDLAYYFSIFVTPHWGEYGTAKTNMKLGMESPFCGLENNSYRHSCGSYIRSEIWACIAAGTPELAVRYMMADSAIDHGGNTEGTYAAVMVAAMEAAAFVESDVNKLIEIGLSYIPEGCDVAAVTRLVQDCYRSGKAYLEARDEVLRLYHGAPFSYDDGKKIVVLCDERDREMGFADGVKGYDVVDNFGIIMIGLLYGQGDFGNTLCYAVNCGEDTDCTAATLGSMLGIIYGAEKIPEKWLRPIGSQISTLCLNHGEIEGMVPKTVEELTERTMRLMRMSDALNDLNLGTTPVTDLICPPLLRNKLYARADCAVYDFKFFEIAVSYPDGIYLKGNSGKVRIRVENKFRVTENVSYRWFAEEGFATDYAEGYVYLSRNTYGDPSCEMDFTFSTEGNPKLKNRFVFQLTVEGRASAMTVPVLFLKGRE